jgi:hypothetical protein
LVASQTIDLYGIFIGYAVALKAYVNDASRASNDFERIEAQVRMSHFEFEFAVLL